MPVLDRQPPFAELTAASQSSGGDCVASQSCPRIRHHGDVGLSENSLLEAAGDVIYARGEDYVRFVRGLRTTGHKAYASIQAKKVYTVELDWSGRIPDGSCTCPHNADGNFCKHLVATGLAAIDSARVAVDATVSGSAEALHAAVQAMDGHELRDLVLTLAQRDDGVRRLLEVRASTKAGNGTQAKAELEAYVRNTLAFRGFVDYRRSFEVAGVASEVLDELENHLNGGAAETARPALLHALTRLRKITEHADDSSGSIGDECQRAADLYARACRLGEPDPVKLAAWLVKFRADSPGWPHLELADFVDSFDERALATYRRAVMALDRKFADRDQFGRFEIDAMLLELADHDGDVDRAVHLLSQREHTQYGAIIDRLRAAGRTEEATAWIDRAVAAGRLSSHGGGNSYWLSPDDVAATYQGLGRTEDAVAVLRSDFVRQPSVPTYRVLLHFAAGIDRAEEQRIWAMDHARQLASDPYAHGAVLVQLLLSEGDVDAAWEAADRYGPGWAWRELADQGAKARPGDAADLYRPQLESDLRYPDTKLYPHIAVTLATMSKLYEHGGRADEFASLIAQIRHDYGRRPSLMKALNAKGL
jgi:uncharacterized Zn finger protein